MIKKPKFWKWARLVVDADNHEEVLQSRLVNIVPGMIFSDQNDDILEKILTAVVEGRSQLKTIRLLSPTSLGPELLSQALIRLEEFSTLPIPWYSTSHVLSHVQFVAVIRAIGQSETNNLKLKVLNSPKSYAEVSPEVLAAALVRLEKFRLPLTLEQNRSLFTKIVESPVVNLKSFTANGRHYGYFENIPPELFADVLVRIETVDLTEVSLFMEVDGEKVEYLLRKIANTEILKIRRLGLNYAKLSHISPLIISQAVVKLEKLTLKSCRLTASQVMAIFSQLSVSEHNMRFLSLDTNLRSVPTELLVKVIMSGLEEVDLSGLTKYQLTGIYTMVVDRKPQRLRRIKLGNNDHSSIPTEKLKAMISGLEEVDLYNTNLTPVQLTGIYTMLADKKPLRLRMIKLGGNDHSSIPTEMLLSVMISDLEEVDLFDTNLTAVQLIGICSMVADEKPLRLKKINLLRNDHSFVSVPTELLDRAVLNKSVEIIF